MKPKVSREEIGFFLQTNQEKFYRIAFSYAKNRDDALDILQSAIVKALEKAETVRSPQYLETWFCRVLINESLQYLRKRQRVVPVEDPEALLEGAADDAERVDRAIDLSRAMEKLDPRSRTVVLLRFFHDMKLEQIAEILDLNLSTTKSRLYKALQILEKEMGGETRG